MKSLARISYDVTSIKLCIFDLYALAWGGVFDTGIELLANLGPLIFTSYPRAYVISF